MKKNFKFLPIIFLFALSASFSSCQKDKNEESCSKPPQDIGTCSADDITVCCDDNEVCYYEYNDVKYDNVDDIALVCSSSSTIEDMQLIKMQFDAITVKLIQEARTAAVCN